MRKGKFQKESSKRKVPKGKFQKESSKRKVPKILNLRSKLSMTYYRYNYRRQAKVDVVEDGVNNPVTITKPLYRIALRGIPPIHYNSDNSE